MLRNRSRTVTKKALMADNNSPTKTPSSPISSFLGSPRFFNGFFSKNIFDTEISMSPTSILDNKTPTSNFANPFKKSPPETTTIMKNNNKQETRAIGLALIDSIIQENINQDGKLLNRMVLLGSNLKVHIPQNNTTNNPTPSSISPIESPKSPTDFGIKTRNISQLSSPVLGGKDLGRQLSLKEMELSEDYTRVITHGPNPKTTHIYDDCIVESSCLDEIKTTTNNNNGFQTTDIIPKSSSMDFMSSCHNCRQILGHGKDIYMYREIRSFSGVRKPFVAMNAAAKKCFLME
ncbi:hypothetical protein MIMGU_mgv1a011071mg [Erythranthe guttata]|uniref:FLZ-type domain-containing protein n=1 Tax=Erythranthe guttata TaxID=4155 RepID=A0A022S3Q5_ERYGU|nr:hypothetical protein MIMGU_mgv1a011071mg [Erythranthe guttata]